MVHVSIDEVLSYIDGSDYETWLAVGMVLHAENFAVSVWRDWSRQQPKYKDGECETKWRSFHENGGMKMGTLIELARRGGMPPDVMPDGEKHGDERKTERGFTPAVPGALPGSRYVAENFSFDWDYEELDDNPAHLQYPAWKQLEVYLKTLYRTDDIVGIANKTVTKWNGEKFCPHGGVKMRVGDVLAELSESRDVEKTIGGIIEKAGAWCYLNTYDETEKFARDNIQSFNYCLIESDSIPKDEQEGVYRQLNLPIAVMVDSGGKSIHAVIRIDAGEVKGDTAETRNESRKKVSDEYSRRVKLLFDYLDTHGVSVDKQDKNPNRMSRLPGVQRGEEKQSLLAVDVGARSWAEFEKSINPDADAPKHKDFIFDLPVKLNTAPELPPVLIDGILRKGGKMVITGAPKSGKSFFAVELGIAISQKMSFLGHEIKERQRVIYFNLENAREESNRRAYDVKEAMGVHDDPDDMFVSVTLTGENYNTEELVDEIERQCAGINFGVVIIDPIYKIMDGDENKAGDVTKMLNQFDRLRMDMNCAVIYTHHHSKGSQGQKDAMDRGSGSGVVSRDFDALIDITRLEVDPDFLEETEHGNASAWRVEYVTRSFKNPEPENMFFEYPVHSLDDDGILDEAVVKGSPEYEAKAKSQATNEFKMRQKQVTWDLRQKKIAAAWDEIGKNRVRKSELINTIFEGVDPDAKVAEWTKSSWNAKLGDVCRGKSDYRLEDGYVVKNVKN